MPHHVGHSEKKNTQKKHAHAHVSRVLCQTSQGFSSHVHCSQMQLSDNVPMRSASYQMGKCVIIWVCVIRTCWSSPTVTYKYKSTCGQRSDNVLDEKQGWVLSWWRLSSLSLPLQCSGMLLWWLMTQRF